MCQVRDSRRRIPGSTVTIRTSTTSTSKHYIPYILALYSNAKVFMSDPNSGGVTAAGGCPPHVLEAIYGNINKKAANEESLRR